MLTLAVLPEVISQWLTDPSRPQWILLLIAAASLVAVIKGADWLVEGAAGLAKKFGMPEIVIGATIVSLGTTSPETAVSVLAAFQGNAGLALGNGVGSIIADTGLIFGIACLLAVLPAERFILMRQGWVQFGVAALLSAWCYGKYLMYGNNAELNLLIGVILLSILVWYLWVSVKWAKQHTQMTNAEQGDDEIDIAKAASKSTGWLAMLGLVGLAFVVFAGSAMVESVGELTLRWGMPEVVVAGTLVAIGTSLPELMVAIIAIRKKHYGLVVGNVIGADILNVLWVIGLSAVGGAIAGQGLPIVEDGKPIVLILHLPMMMTMLVLFRVYIHFATKRGSFQRWMGWPLVILYVVYVVMSFVVSSPSAGH